MKLEKIQIYPSNLQLHTTQGVLSLDFDGQQGLYTEDEWREDEVISQFDHEDQIKILDTLSLTCNTDFFAEE